MHKSGTLYSQSAALFVTSSAMLILENYALKVVSFRVMQAMLPWWHISRWKLHGREATPRVEIVIEPIPQFYHYTFLDFGGMLYVKNKIVHFNFNINWWASRIT